MIESRPLSPRLGRRNPVKADGALRTRREQGNWGGRDSRPRDGNGRAWLREGCGASGPAVSHDCAVGKPMGTAFRGRAGCGRFIFRAASEAVQSCMFGKQTWKIKKKNREISVRYPISAESAQRRCERKSKKQLGGSQDIDPRGRSGTRGRLSRHVPRTEAEGRAIRGLPSVLERNAMRLGSESAGGGSVSTGCALPTPLSRSRGSRCQKCLSA